MSQKSPKPPMIAAADHLAATSRKLRAAAEQPAPADVDRVVRKLTSLSTFETSKAEDLAKLAKEDAAAHAKVTIAPLVERAQRRLDDAAALKEAHGAFIKRLSALDFDAIRKRVKLRVSDSGSLESSVTRVSLLQRAVSDARELLESNDGELVVALAAVERLERMDTKDAEVAVGTLRYFIQLMGGTPDAIRSRIKGVCRLLAEIGADIESGKGADQIPEVKPEWPREVSAVPSTLWTATEYTPPAAAEEK